MSRISENIRKITKAWGGKTTGNGISDALSDLYNNLPFGEETKTEYNTLFDNITVSENGSFFGGGVLYGAFDFDIVNNFTVIFDGVEYNCEVTPKRVQTSYLGNKTLTNLSNPGENTNEPFCIAADFFFNVDDMSEDVNDRIYLAEPGVNHTLTIKKKTVQTVVTPLPAKFLPEPIVFTSTDGQTFTCNKTYDECLSMIGTPFTAYAVLPGDTTLLGFVAMIEDGKIMYVFSMLSDSGFVPMPIYYNSDGTIESPV